MFTIQGYTGLKEKNILSRFLPATKWKKVVANTMFFTYLSVSISSLVKLPAIETFFFTFFDLLSKSTCRAHGTRLVCFALFFTHGHESVKCKGVSREMYWPFRSSSGSWGEFHNLSNR